MCAPQTLVFPDINAVRFVRDHSTPPSSLLKGVLSRHLLGGNFLGPSSSYQGVSHPGTWGSLSWQPCVAK